MLIGRKGTIRLKGLGAALAGVGTSVARMALRLLAARAQAVGGFTHPQGADNRLRQP